MARRSRFSEEVRERAVRMVFEHGNEHGSEWEAMCSIAEKIGCSAETLRKWVRRVRAAYDAALQKFDLLALPTAPSKAQPLPAPDASLAEVVQAAWSNIANTQPFDHSHHPVISVPCGTSEGLPVGLMLVGRAFEESTIYRAAHAFEQHADWRTL